MKLYKILDVAPRTSEAFKDFIFNELPTLKSADLLDALMMASYHGYEIVYVKEYAWSGFTALMCKEIDTTLPVRLKRERDMWGDIFQIGEEVKG